MAGNWDIYNDLLNEVSNSDKLDKEDFPGFLSSISKAITLAGESNEFEKQEKLTYSLYRSFAKYANSLNSTEHN